MKTKPFTSSDREFLELVSQAVFANPFSEDRVHADLAIAGAPSADPPERLLDSVLKRVREFIGALEAKDKSDLSAYGGADRQLLETAHLFDVFHQFMQALDDLIRAQIKSPEQPCPVPFATDVLDELVSRGFPRAESVRYFAMFYQLRRAFYFIECALVGRSPCMQLLRRSLWQSVFTSDMRLYERFLWNRMEDFSTLLLGETGTGKGAAATAIGRSGFIPFDLRKGCFSESFMSTFIEINLSQFPESLIESELFGHRKGSFTGAIEAHEGVFARCSPCGSIFLDEIGDVSIPVQIKLLKVLQDREFSPVGSHDKRQFRGRVIAASNKSIDELRKAKLFRDDFFYRLCSDRIVVPPLRQRLSESGGELDDLVALIVRRILGDEAGEDLTALVRGIIDEQVGMGYAWPGNVRELEQCVRRILLTRRYEGERSVVEMDQRAALEEGIAAGALTAQEVLSRYCRILYAQHGTYEEVARRTALDRRTVKKYIGG